MFEMLSVPAELQRELIVANTDDGLASAQARGRGPNGDASPLARLYARSTPVVSRAAGRDSHDR
jgi:DNA invertase Pin-like site-specific DNA recombinase